MNNLFFVLFFPLSKLIPNDTYVDTRLFAMRSADHVSFLKINTKYGAEKVASKVCLHLNHYHRQIYILPMVIDRLMSRIGLEPILPVKWSVNIGTMIKFDQ